MANTPESTKTCLQTAHPDLQTPCFKAVDQPCSEPTCNVLIMVKVLYQVSGQKVTIGELRELFHLSCNQSNMGPDAANFNTRILERIDQGVL